MSENTWLLTHCTCYGAPDETGYIDPFAGPENYEMMLDPKRDSFCSQSAICRDSVTLEHQLTAARAEAQQLREEAARIRVAHEDSHHAWHSRAEYPATCKSCASERTSTEAENARLRSELEATEQARDREVAWSDAAAKASEMFLEELDTLQAQLAQAVAALDAELNNGPNQLMGTVPLSAVRATLALLRGTEVGTSDESA